jgi:hypothetical protein
MTDTSDLTQSLGISQFGQLNERGKSVIQNIRDLQKTEEGLFAQLQTGASTFTLTQSQQEELVKQITNVSDARYNLYLELQQNQVYYQDNVNVSHNILTQETDTLEVVERELNRAEKRIGLIREQRNNRLRLVEINRYYGDKYKHHTLILKYITLLFTVVLIIAYFYNQGVIPQPIFTTAMVIVGSVGSYFVIKEMWDAYARDSMMYQQYNWNMLKGEPTLVTGKVGETNPFQKDLEGDEETCIGQACCQPSYTWVPSPFNKCYPNDNLDSADIREVFPKGITAYQGDEQTVASAGGSSNPLQGKQATKEMQTQLAKY